MNKLYILTLICFATTMSAIGQKPSIFKIGFGAGIILSDRNENSVGSGLSYPIELTGSNIIRSAGQNDTTLVNIAADKVNTEDGFLKKPFNLNNISQKTKNKLNLNQKNKLKDSLHWDPEPYAPFVGIIFSAGVIALVVNSEDDDKPVKFMAGLGIILGLGVVLAIYKLFRKKKRVKLSIRIVQ